MDYLDTKKQSRHNIMLYLGYFFIGTAVFIGTFVLVQISYGIHLTKKGVVVQNGLVFLSSHPNPASIYMNGTLKPVKTNARLALLENIYDVTLARDGYRDWIRTIEVDGGQVRHFDYPFLFPKALVTKKTAALVSPPSLTSQSPDQRWLLVQPQLTSTSFDIYDLKNPSKAPVVDTLPANLATKPAGTELWQASEWSDDNNHLVLIHQYDDKFEYILLDRKSPEQSINLTQTLKGNFTKLTLLNKKYDKFYLLDGSSGDLQTASIGQPEAQPLLQHVAEYQSYGDNTVLYATTADAPAGKALIKMRVKDQTYLLHTVTAGGTYLLNLTGYSGDLYVVLGASPDNKLYIYKDPVGQLSAQQNNSLAPSQVFHVTSPNYVSFSTNAQFIVAESGTQFGVYDIENDKGYNYTSQQPLDAPQKHASWMDGDRLTYVSGGKLLVFDYDYTNQQVLNAADSNYLPAFAPDFKFVYTISTIKGPNKTPQTGLAQTGLLIPGDQ